MTFIAVGFVLGVAASVHCVVMCGPLMLAVLPRRNGRAALLYHGGGAAGQLAVLAGLGRLLSVGAGLALIWTATRRAGWLSTNSRLGLGRHATRIIVRATQATRARFHASSPIRLVSAGALNGLLPCGAVYAALTGAAAGGDSRLSAGFMLAFGAGTLPALAAAGTIAARIPCFGGGRWRLITPAALAVLGVLLTVRGFLPSHHPAEPSPVHHHAAHNAAMASSLVNCAEWRMTTRGGLDARVRAAAAALSE
jgi:uncharacterized protein